MTVDIVGSSTMHNTDLARGVALDLGTGGDVAEWHLHGVLDAVQQLYHHAGHVLERELTPLRRTQRTPHLQGVEQQRLPIHTHTAVRWGRDTLVGTHPCLP